VPWTAIRDSQSTFVSSRYLPSGGKLKDPSKLQASDVDSLLQFWGARQDAGEELVFLFRRWQDKDKEMRLPVKEQTTDESASDAPPDKRTKATRKVISAKGRGKRQRGQSNHRQRVESDVDDDMEGCQDEDDPTNVLSGGKSASKTFVSDLVQSPSVTTSVVPGGKAVGQSGLQQNPAQPLPAAESDLAPVAVKRKRARDVENLTQDERPAKKSKAPTAVALPQHITASTSRSFGPQSGGKRKTKDNVKTSLPDPASDVPARRTRSKVAKEPLKAKETRRSRK
jgi:hypothetical protein